MIERIKKNHIPVVPIAENGQSSDEERGKKRRARKQPATALPDNISTAGTGMTIGGESARKEKLRQEILDKQGESFNRMRKFFAELDAVKFHAEPEIQEAIKIFHKKITTMRAKGSGETLNRILQKYAIAREKSKSDDASSIDEIRPFLLLYQMLLDRGLIPRDKHNAINPGMVVSHMRAYLSWRWCEEKWRTNWNEWNNKQKEKKHMPSMSRPATFPGWLDALTEWSKARENAKPDSEPVRPPGLPADSNLVVAASHRFGLRHMDWPMPVIRPSLLPEEPIIEQEDTSIRELSHLKQAEHIGAYLPTEEDERREASLSGPLGRLKTEFNRFLGFELETIESALKSVDTRISEVRARGELTDHDKHDLTAAVRMLGTLHEKFEDRVRNFAKKRSLNEEATRGLWNMYQRETGANGLALKKRIIATQREAQDLMQHGSKTDEMTAEEYAWADDWVHAIRDYFDQATRDTLDAIRAENTSLKRQIDEAERRLDTETFDRERLGRENSELLKSLNDARERVASALSEIDALKSELTVARAQEEAARRSTADTDLRIASLEREAERGREQSALLTVIVERLGDEKVRRSQTALGALALLAEEALQLINQE